MRRRRTLHGCARFGILREAPLGQGTRESERERVRSNSEYEMSWMPAAGRPSTARARCAFPHFHSALLAILKHFSPLLASREAPGNSCKMLGG